MPLVINATEETITTRIQGNYFTFKPGQEKTIRSEEVCHFIQTERRGCGLAVLPSLTTQAEDEGDVEVTAEDLAQRKSARDEQKNSALKSALHEYIRAKREVIRNNQVSLAKDLARADYKYGPEHDISDGELDAMRLVAKYDSKGKDAEQDRLEEIEKLKKKIAGK
jgi:hypothetical protein